MRFVKKTAGQAVRPLLTILVSLLIGALLIFPSGESPLHAYAVLFAGAFGSVTGWLGTLARATPLIFTGLAAAVASRSGVFNIGIEGQLYLGALAAAMVGVTCGALPPFLLIPLCLLAAMAAAVLWGMIPGLLNSKLGINIFIMFFMLNNMAMLLTEYLANGPFQGDLATASTARISENAMLLRFSRYADFNAGFFVAVAAAAVLWFAMYKTKFGYECGALGHNRTFSQYIGVHIGGKTLLVLAISSAIAGLAGAEQVMGFMGRFHAGFSNQLGFTGISVAMLAKNHPVGVVIFAIFFGALNNGALQLAAQTGVPSDLVNSLQAVMIIFISADFMVHAARRAKHAKLEEKEAEQ